MEYVKLHYGYQETESGIYHSFVTTDVCDKVDTDEIGAKLADALECDCNDPDSGFHWGTMDIELPANTVVRIYQVGYARALDRYGYGDGPWSNDACKGYAIMAMKRAGLDAETIRKVSDAMTDCFDDTTVEAAGRYYMKGSVQ